MTLSTKVEKKIIVSIWYKKILSMILISLGLVSCSSKQLVPPKLDPNLRPVEYSYMQEISENSEVCPSPQPVPTKFNREIKYGCFCGENYPGFSNIDMYYLVKPYDSIDEVCRDHDVCWTLKGKGDGDCNDEFYNRLDYLSKRFDKHPDVQGWLDIDNKYYRCSNLTLKMKAIFLSSIIPYEYAEPGKTTGSSIGRFISNFILAPIFLIKGDLPQEGENCTP